MAAGDVVAIVRLVVVAVARRVVAWPVPQAAANAITTPTRRLAVGSGCMPPRYDRYGRIW